MATTLLSPPTGNRGIPMTADVLMDWAEGTYGNLFPGHMQTVVSGPWQYRAYSNGNYLGVNGSEVFVLGPVAGSSSTALRVGSLADFACSVDSRNCTVGPASLSEAARFLTQATLGYSRREVSDLLVSSYEQWIAAQMTMPRTQSHFEWLLEKGYGAATFENSFTGLDNTLWRKLISSPDSLRQRMTLALSEILVVSAAGISGVAYRQFCVAAYLDILEEHAFGNYRTLLEKVTLSPAMSIYLTYRGNRKENATTGSQPDENYARELMQLFTIGLLKLNPDGTPVTVSGVAVETYAQEDVSGLARVFTGWDIDAAGTSTANAYERHRKPLVQVASRYETGAKSFLGASIPAGTNASSSLSMALDTLFNHPNTAPFVSRQLIQRLVTSNPSADYVQRVASIFANNGNGVRGDLAATLKAILLDIEARNQINLSNTTFGKIREPVVRFLNWARAFSAAEESTDPQKQFAIGDTSDPGTRLGQSPMRSPSVFNFFRPGYVPPGTTIAAQGLTAPEFQIATESSVAGYVNFVQSFVAGSRTGTVSVDYGSLLALVDDSAALLDEINLVLAAGQLSSTTLASLKTALESIAVTTTTGRYNRIHAALTLVMAAPEYIVQK